MKRVKDFIANQPRHEPCRMRFQSGYSDLNATDGERKPRSPDDAPFCLGKGQDMRGHIETVERIFTSKASLRSGRIFGYFWLQNFCPGGMAAKSCTKPGFLMFWCA